MTAQRDPAPAYPPGTAYIDGDFRPISEAKISVLDWGLLRSDATYDVVHVWRGRFFRLELHLDRFLNSVQRLRLELPFDRAALTATLMQCVRRSGLRDAYVEMICTRGHAADFSRDPRDAVNRFIAFAIPFSWVADDAQRQRGLHIAVRRVRRIPPSSVDPTVKNYHWLDFVNGLFEAYDRGAENVVLVDARGDIAEGPGFNLFAVKDGAVLTPAEGTLQGITRRTALELCAELAVPGAPGRAHRRRIAHRRRGVHHLHRRRHYAGHPHRRRARRLRPPRPADRPPDRPLLAKTHRPGLDHPAHVTTAGTMWRRKS